MDEFYKDNSRSSGLTCWCKKCKSENRENNYQRHLDHCKVHRDKNKEYKKLYNANYDSAKYQRNRRRIDPLFRLSKNLRSRLSSALKSKKWKKNTRFSQYIGCSQQDLVLHIESQFRPGMTWGNYGLWEIDHINPLSRAKNEEEMYLLCHFSNLQPLWKEENRKKSNKKQSLDLEYTIL